MAKKKKNISDAAAEANQNNPNRIYIFAAIVLAVFSTVFIVIMFQGFDRTKVAYDGSINSIKNVSNVNNELLTTNTNLLMLVAGTASSDPTNTINDIHASFDNITNELNAYEATEKSEAETHRYKHAKAFIDAYRERVDLMLSEFIGGDSTVDVRRNTYVQEIHPLQTTAIEMFSVTMELSERYANERIANIQRTFMISVYIIIAVTIAGEIIIFIIARISKRNREALAKQAAEIEAATRKFKHTKEKANEMAYTNILTGLKNRYALDNDLTPRLEGDQFNIAVFDLDNFRSINDMYGYDFGDEYLAMVAERLKADYSNDADIYNITGNEFCFVFNREVSDMQAARIAEHVIQTLAEWYTVANLNVQLTASGSTYHYLPGDCMTVSALLVKLDNVLRDAKRNGGNMVLQVMGI
ncbi:MAG: GGDEF domain-containing protein [Ruminococcus sp.]|nr:GGDEF domain-containing protein [Ruminococcus sp.]